jgi:hypothetical protein
VSFTALYWDFIARNRDRLQGSRRMQMPVRNLERIDPASSRRCAHAAGSCAATSTPETRDPLGRAARTSGDGSYGPVVALLVRNLARVAERSA